MHWRDVPYSERIWHIGECGVPMQFVCSSMPAHSDGILRISPVQHQWKRALGSSESLNIFNKFKQQQQHSEAAIHHPEFGFPI